MKGFDLKFLEELKSKNDIVEVIGAYVPLTRRGNSFWGRCPFHHEKTPSFCVNGTDQFYYCFGCHKSGDVISFVKEMESLDFADAVRFLAERAKMPMPEFSVDDAAIKEQKQKRETLYALLKDAARFYAKNLRSGDCPAHEEYIVKRGLSADTVNKFGIGASKDYDGLVKYLSGKGYSYENMFESGAVGKTERGGNVRYYDALAGRLIIPVIDGFNNVVAFCGRIIDERRDVGKYVNTKETPVFAKGKTLFNLNNLKKYKNDYGLSEIIMVEGHMDVVSLVQAGFNNVVASMGTALTKDQARILKRYSDKVLISYDGDFAGQKAAIRGLEILRDEGLDVKVVALPDGLDPDDVVKKQGKDAYEKLLKDAMPLIDFKLNVLKKAFDIKTADGKRKFVAGAIKVIKESESAAEQEDLLKAVRDYTGITLEALKRDLDNTETKAPEVRISVATDNENSGDKTDVAARYVLYSALFNKPYAEDEDFSKIEFILPEHNRIAEYVMDCRRENTAVRFNDLYSIFDEDSYKELDAIAGLNAEEDVKFDRETYFFDCLKTLKVYSLDKKLEILNARFKTETDADIRRELVAEINKVIIKRKELN
ncbi:MAG: DNA primase [Clostridia bacterium]|nr:DNA primase [Clostridia bacterium]